MDGSNSHHPQVKTVATSLSKIQTLHSYCSNPACVSNIVPSFCFNLFCNASICFDIGFERMSMHAVELTLHTEYNCHYSNGSQRVH